MQRMCAGVVTAAARRRSLCVWLSFLVAATLITSACGESNGDDSGAAGATEATGLPSPPEPILPTITVSPPVERTTPPTPPEPDDPPDDPGESVSGPPDPGTPRLIVEGRCGEVLDQMNEFIELSLTAEAEAFAYRGFAKLCLRDETATDDLDFARDHGDDLTPETRELLEAVTGAGVPRGEELRDLLRDELPVLAQP